MSEISKTYDPSLVEDKWYQFWQENDCFKADSSRVSAKRPPYSIVIPPPNVTGVLHMGHVLNNTIQDVLARKARMDGKEVLWLPGTDHAGIATQVVVEKQIKKEERKTRHDLGRDAFIERVWDWKDHHGGIIVQQLRKLGCSCDWSRERFTMDEDYSACVRRVFVKLFEKGAIYRGKRMVNWCPASLTALSDEEVEMTPQSGFLYRFKVEVADEPGRFLEIATTRPETIPGDTAIAVHPEDERYKDLVGRTAIRPLPRENQVAIPIVADTYIDKEFGTGVLKVTPAHDKADFELGQRHNLEAIDVMRPDGTMSAAAGEELQGMDRFDARKKAAELLEEMELLVEREPYQNNVGFSERAKIPIEPRLSEQWFLRYPSQEEASACVRDGSLRFHPERWAKTYDHWMGGLQDWCISRQLWWGHRAPVWTWSGSEGALDSLGSDLGGAARNQLGAHSKEPCARVSASGLEGHASFLAAQVDEDDGVRIRLFVATESDEEAAALQAQGWEQDSDVLDTWFSSWLWPFATMGWPDSTDDLKAFYPTSDLVTGPDIIFFWVARMIMAGYEFMDDLPFRNVYFTGIIRDKKGRKMSKSLGNSPNPLDLISKYGADALRFGTMRAAPLGQDVLFDEKDVELGRNFLTKLWNATRFRQMQGGETESEIRPDQLTIEDRWILWRLDVAIRDVTQALENYRFNDAVSALYRFFWSEFCDWYLETAKAAFFGESGVWKANTLATLDFILSNVLRLFHPFLPFITEELWNGMGFQEDLPEVQGGKTITNARWPKPLDQYEKEYYQLDETAAAVAEARHELVSSGRNLRAQFGITPQEKLRFVFKPQGDVSDSDVAVLRLLLNAESIEVAPNYQRSGPTPSVVSPYGELFLPLQGVIDFEVERARLAKELKKIEAEIGKAETKLSNPKFADRAPAEVIQEIRDRLDAWVAKRVKIEEAISSLES